MKARINEWLRTALIMLGESILWRDFNHHLFISVKFINLPYTNAPPL